MGSVSAITKNSAELQTAQLVSQASVSLVFVTTDSGEGFLTVGGNYGDRNNWTLWDNGDELIQSVAA